MILGGNTIIGGKKINVKSLNIGEVIDDLLSVKFNDIDSNKLYGKFAIASGKDNIAGSKGFTITAVDATSRTYTLDSVDGLEIGDVYSVRIGSQFEDVGQITAIDTETNVVTVDVHSGHTSIPEGSDASIEEDGFDHENLSFRIPLKPEIGTRYLGNGTTIGGFDNKALSKGATAFGGGNYSRGSYATCFGSNNEATYCGMAFGKGNKVTGFNGVGIGSDNIVTSYYGIGIGYQLSVLADYQTALGRYNKEDENALLVIGNGTDNDNRSNAHTVDWDGNAWYAGDVKVGGTSYDDANATELATKKYVDNTIDEALERKADKTSVDAALERIKYYGSADIVPSDSSYFTVNETGETITGLTDTGKTQTELVIPYEIDGVKITTLCSGVFEKSILDGATNKITKIIIPKTVIGLGMYAFYHCTSLTSINIPNSVRDIGNAAFDNCTSLTSINIPNSVTSIGYEAFNDCSLTSINIPNSVTSIRESAFYGNILKIHCEQGSYADTFAKSNYMSVVYTEVDPTEYLTKDNTTEFTPTGDYQPATKKYVDDSVASAGGGDMLTSVYDKDNDGIIDDVALLQYYGTTDITISDSSYFTVNETGETITGLTDTGKTQTELVIPYEIDGVKITTLCSGVFEKSILDGATNKITKIIIPKTVIGLGRSAFNGCSSLTSINIPNSVRDIGNEAFYGCSSLTSINIPNSVRDIGNGAFYGCTSLTSINIPNSVRDIGNGAFYTCSSLTSINIPNSVTSIGDGAFTYCSSLTSINIPNSVTSIDNGAFTYCSSLTSINIPNSVRDIGNGAFSNCASLTSINISNSVTSIGNGAFYGCSSLTKIDIPNSVTSIDDYAFDSCTNLKIYCEQGSYAETYAKSNNIPVVYTAVNDIGSGVEIVDNLTTSDSTKALSANQGRVLKSQIDGKAHTSHASAATTYGVGTSTDYGHLKVADNLTTTTSGTALSANQGKVLKAEIDELVTSIEEKANSDLSNLSDASTALANLGLTATATEINYTDGVTSNIQTQLNNKASSSHIQPASTITSGTFSSTSIKAATGTDYTTARIRNIQASTTDLTAGISALSNGDIYFVYE